MNWNEIMTNIIMPIIGVIFGGSLGVKGFTHLKHKKNGGTIHQQLAKVNTQIEINNSRLKALERDVNIIKKHLIEKGKK